MPGPAMLLVIGASWLVVAFGSAVLVGKCIRLGMGTPSDPAQLAADEEASNRRIQAKS